MEISSNVRPIRPKDVMMTESEHLCAQLSRNEKRTQKHPEMAICENATSITEASISDAAATNVFNAFESALDNKNDTSQDVTGDVDIPDTPNALVSLTDDVSSESAKIEPTIDVKNCQTSITGISIDADSKEHSHPGTCQDNVDTLKALIKEAAKLSNIAISQEVKHKDLASQRLGVIQSLNDSKHALEELKRLVLFQQGILAEKCAYYDSLADKMSALSSEESSTQEKLFSIRKQIRILRKVNVYIFSSEISIETFSTLPKWNTKAISDKLTELVENPNAGELTVTELRLIAKLMVMVSYFGTNDIDYELSFDSQKVQKFFETVSVS